MALEGEGNVNYIDDLSGFATNPENGDDPTEGAEHIRLTKKAVYQSFPNIDGAVTATDTELNLCAGASETDNAALIPATTVMCFYQAAAPTGWTGSDVLANNMLRVVTTASGNGGAAAGSDSPILMNKVPSHTHTFTSDTDGGHGHYFRMRDATANSQGTGGVFTDVDADGDAQMYASFSHNATAMIVTGSDSNHAHDGTTDANGSAANWTPLYASVIFATKDAY